MHFRRGLNEELKDILAGKTILERFLEYSNLCITLDNNLFARKKEKRGFMKPFP